MKWKKPPVIKVYEALGAIADGHVQVSGDSAKIFSSSGNKSYDVTWDPKTQAIMANDNGSYWKGYLGYPSIAFLLSVGTFNLKPEMAKLLKGIAWKDINQKFKNDFDKTLVHIESSLSKEERGRLSTYTIALETQITQMRLSLLGTKQKPPDGY